MNSKWLKGLFFPDATPVEVPLDMQRPETLEQMMARMIQTDVLRRSVSTEAETFEEANDFDCEDGEERIFSQYQTQECLEEVPIVSERSSESRERAASDPDGESVESGSNDSGDGSARSGDADGGGGEVGGRVVADSGKGDSGIDRRAGGAAAVAARGRQGKVKQPRTR